MQVKLFAKLGALSLLNGTVDGCEVWDRYGHFAPLREKVGFKLPRTKSTKHCFPGCWDEFRLELVVT